VKSHILLTAILTAPAFAQPSLTLSPAVITTCSFPGFGRTRIFWNVSGTDSVQLRAGGPSGTIMGVEPPQGSTGTGDWVQDGMVFALTTADGQQLASATARVLCQPPSSQVSAALAAGSYLPLDIGNEWVYRVDDRSSTALYQRRRVERADVINGTLYFVVSFRTGARGVGTATATEVPYRTDTQGRVYYLTSSNTEQLLFDPAGVTPGALYKVLTRGQPTQTPLGNFADALTYEWPNGLDDERGTYARGVGFISSSTQLLAGSSGGFDHGYTLAYARVAGNLVFAAPAPGLELTAESRDLDVTGGHVTNCAVPCYFVACGLVPGADPPGTYKPCFQARVRLQESPALFTSADAQTRTVLLDLLDSGNRVVSGATDTVTIGVGQPEAVVSHSIPLPLIPGQYRLRVRIVDSTNVETDSAFVAVKIR
jgi:hypothetical protein